MISTSQTPKSIAIVGATGAVGIEFLSILEKINFPIKELRLLASSRSAGKELTFKKQKIKVQELKPDSFKGIDIALFSAGSSISKKYEQDVVDSHCVLIDNSSAFRMRKNTPLVIPEINPDDALKHKGVIANPNCSTIIMLMGTYPLHAQFPIKKAVVSTYQAASGAGWEAMEELKGSTQAILESKPFAPQKMPYPYGFNLFSHNSPIDESGYNEEETKMINETSKILGANSFDVTATCIRVPVLRAHSESICLEFIDKAPSREEAAKLYNEFPGMQVIDDREKNYFPMPLDASGQYDCFVGRIRKDNTNPEKGLQLFVAGDQLLKGAALNTVQIACLL